MPHIIVTLDPTAFGLPSNDAAPTVEFDLNAEGDDHVLAKAVTLSVGDTISIDGRVYRVATMGFVEV